jgi:hypothetical protein
MQPDLRYVVQGIRILIEAKLAGNAQGIANLETQASQRIEDGVANIVIGMIYDPRFDEMGDISDEELINELRSGTTIFEINKIWGADAEGKVVILENEQRITGFAELISYIRNIPQLILSHILNVDNITAKLQQAIEDIRNEINVPETDAERLAPILDLAPPDSEKDSRSEYSAKVTSVLKMAILVLLNACIFYEKTYRNFKDPHSNSPLLPIPNYTATQVPDVPPSQTLFDLFSIIYPGINFEMIFSIAIKILEIINGPDEERGLAHLVQHAHSIARSPILLKHDLMGRIFHLLLYQKIAKSYSTYFTNPNYALLLALVSVRWDNPDWDLENNEFLNNFKVCDFTCGSGTLLVAAYKSLFYQYFENCLTSEEPYNANKFHKNFIEKSCYGFDVMIYALHMSLSTIALINANVIFAGCNFYKMGLGLPDRLGSLDFLKANQRAYVQQRLDGGAFGIQRVQFDKQDGEVVGIRNLARLRYRLVIMNPPFARNCGDNVQFGADRPRQERAILNKVLSDLRNQRHLSGIGKAGPIGDYVIMALEKTEVGGRISFILPKGLCDGASLQKIRQYLVRFCHLEFIFFNHHSPYFSFSENTDMSECMLVARKLREIDHNHVPEDIPAEGLFTYVVNLRQEIVSEYGAYGLFCEMLAMNPEERSALNIYQAPGGHRTQGYKNIRENDNTEIGNVYTIEQKKLDKYSINWSEVIGLYPPVLHQILFSLLDSSIFTDGQGSHTIRLPLASLRTIGSIIGPDRSGLSKKTTPGEGPNSIPFYWGRTNDDITSYIVKPNQERVPKPTTTQALYRGFNGARSHLLLPETAWLPTTAFLGVYCIKNALSNIFWSCTFPPLNTQENSPLSPVEMEKITMMWSNSTLGVLLMFAIRAEARGPFTHWKKESLPEYIVPDPRRMTRTQIDALIRLFDEFSSQVEGTHFNSVLEPGEDTLRKDLDNRLISILNPQAAQNDIVELFANLYVEFHTLNELWKYEGRVAPSGDDMEEGIEDEADEPATLASLEKPLEKPQKRQRRRTQQESK